MDRLGVELDSILGSIYQGTIVRSRARELYIDSVDRPLSFFLEMEKTRGKNKFISLFTPASKMTTKS
jgi:hypothetical protein